MKLKSFLTLTTFTAAVVLSASTVSAAPFVFGTANGPGSEIFRFDLGTNTKSVVLDTLTANDGIAFDPQGRILFTVEDPQGDAGVYRVNQDGTGLVKLAGNAQVGGTGFAELKDIVLDPSGTSALIVDGGAGVDGHKLYRVDLCAVPPCTVTQIGGTFATNDGPHGLVYVGNKLFTNIGDRTAGLQDSRVAELNPLTGAIIQQSTAQVPNLAMDGLTFDPITGRLYASSVLNAAVYAFNPNNLQAVGINGAGSPLATLFVGQNLSAPDGLIPFSPDGISAHLLVPSFGNNKLMDCTIATNTCVQRGADILGIDHLVAGPTTAVPEPGSMLLLGSGLLLGVRKLRQRRVQK